MDHSPPGSSVNGTLQARILEWVAIPFPRRPSWPRFEPRSPALQAASLLSESPGNLQQNNSFVSFVILHYIFTLVKAPSYIFIFPLSCYLLKIFLWQEKDGPLHLSMELAFLSVFIPFYRFRLPSSITCLLPERYPFTFLVGKYANYELFLCFMSKTAFISSLFLKAILLAWHFFLSVPWNMLIYCLLTCIAPDEKSAVILIFCFPLCSVSFFSDHF